MIISAGMRNDGRPIEAVDVRDIKVGVRRRLNLGRYHDLAASIERFGMLHVVLITADGRLVSGARRLAAAKSLGWEEVPGIRLGNLTQPELRYLELMLSTCRKGYTKKELALIDKEEKERG